MALRDLIIGPGDEFDGLQFYKGGKDKTPTGKSNAFSNNPYGMSEKQVFELGKKLGFRTSSNKEFQEDMYNYIQKNNPEILQQLVTEFGEPNAGMQDGKFVPDGILGARTAFLMNKIPPPPPEIPPGKIPPPEEPTSQYMVNVRGDEGGDRGAYYFLKDKDTFRKLAESLKGKYSKVDERGNDYGQITIDMNDDVLRDRLSKNPEVLEQLGKAMIRDKNNPKKFVPKERK